MKQWLQWHPGEFGPVLTGKTKNLYQGESPEDLLHALDGANPEALDGYKEPLYEVLIAMAEQNDASAVRRLLGMCPALDLRGYREGFTALGAAAVKGAVDAMDALWELGAGTALGVGLSCDALGFCWQYEVPPEAVKRIFSHGAFVDSSEATELMVNEEWALLRLALEAAKPERIAGLRACVRECLADAPENGETLEKGLELLAEFL